MFKKSFLLVLGILFASVSAKADTIQIQITDAGESRYAIGVPDFLTEKGKKAGGDANKIHDLLIQDLRIAGIFEVWNQSRLPHNDFDMQNIDFTKWQALDIQALVKGVMTKEGGKDAVQLRLYDVSDGRLLVGKQYSYDGNGYVDVVHRFVDSVMKSLTGKRGPFESRIAASCGKSGKENIVAFEVDNARRWSYTGNSKNNISPAWSPDGKRIAYTGRIDNGELHIFVTGGGGSKQVTHYGAINLTPAWTSDGSRLVISSDKSEDSELYLINLNGKVISQLTKSYLADIGPSVSPRGEIVFSSERAGMLHLFRTGVGGGGTDRMTYVGRYNEQPDWSSDGSKIAFASGGGIQQIYVMEGNGSNIFKLTDEGSNESPSWSPDDRYIAFSSTRGGVYVMKEDGTNQVQIEKTGGCKNVDWGPWLSKE